MSKEDKRPKKEKHINLDDPRAKKTIFGSTEKSNFILNMTIEQLDKWIYTIMLLTIFSVALGGIGSHFYKDIAVFPMMFYSIAGVFAMIFILIAFQRKQYGKDLIALSVSYGVLFLCAAVSAVLAKSIEIALKGFHGRGEGLLTLFFYFSFYLMAVKVSDTKKNFPKILDLTVYGGLLQCLIAAFQMIPATAETITFAYTNLRTMVAYGVYLPSGTSASPIIFAQYLAVVLPITIYGAIWNDSTKKRLFYTISTAIFIFFMIQTSVVMTFIGALSTLTVIVICSVRKDGHHKLTKSFLFIAVIAMSFWVLFLLKGHTSYITTNVEMVNDELVATQTQVTDSDFQLYDTAVIWEDSSYRLEATGVLKITENSYDPKIIDIKSYKRVLSNDLPQYDAFLTYKYLWGRTIDIATENPKNFIIGVGEENLSYYQYLQLYDYTPLSKYPHPNFIVQYNNTFDKSYNDFVYIFATRGILGVLSYIAFLIFAFRRYRKGNPLKTVCLISCIIYLTTSLLSFGTIEVTSVFFIFLGLMYSKKESNPM